MSRYLEAAGLRKAAGAIVFPTGYASISAWVLGYADRARARIAQAIAFARDSKNPFDLAVGRGIESYLYRWLREPPHALDAATQAVAICEKHSLPLYRDSASMLMGWARAQLGSTGEGVSLVRKGVASLTKAGSRSDITNSFTILAEAQALDGKIDDALGTIEDALHANPEELPYRPNILTWRGNCALRSARPDWPRPTSGRLSRSHKR